MPTVAYPKDKILFLLDVFLSLSGVRIPHQHHLKLSTNMFHQRNLTDSSPDAEASNSNVVIRAGNTRHGPHSGPSKRAFLDEVYAQCYQPGIPKEVENKEALLVLEIARAQRDVHHAEKVLAECVVREHEKIADLHRFRAIRIQGTVDDKDLNIGWINASFTSNNRARPAPIVRAPDSYRPQSDSDGTLKQRVSGRFLAVRLD